MRQLVQLQKDYDEYKHLNSQIVAVFREEDKGLEGLAKSQEKIKAAFPLLLDLGKEKTGAYSREGFATYIVNQNGKIAAMLPGTKMRRPDSEKILAALRGLTDEN